MKRTIRLRLNGVVRDEVVDEASVALDWLRNSAGLKGVKEGCREGDCGACLVLVGGRAPDGSVEWRSATSCTLAMGELDGASVVTIEGLASAGLTPVMEAMLDEGASQCGFCSPGFVLALTGFLVAGERVDPVEAMKAVEGNLCRCTGYGSIRRAASRLAADFADLPGGPGGDEARMSALAARGVLPEHLAATMLDPPEPYDSGALGREAASRGSPGSPEATGAPSDGAGRAGGASLVLGGGTDYYVRNPDPEPGLAASFSSRGPGARAISAVERDGERWVAIGPGVSATDFFASPLVRAAVPGIERFEREVASPPIRNRATIAGNIANASPIADMSAMLIALGARLELRGPGTGDAGGAASVVGGGQNSSVAASLANARELALEDFFLAYKKTALRPGEAIARILVPSGWSRFGFEKAAKRERLDIATVNCAMSVRLAPDGTIADARYSAGGVAPVPLRLREIESLARGRKPSAELAREAGALASKAGSPMSDVRGSSVYRERLLERLCWALFMRLWPELSLEEGLLL